jgi:uncharacterized alpha-E superfamily protein
MLSRTAGTLFWLARYVERAENMARLLDVAMRMSSLPHGPSDGPDEWHSAIVAAGCEHSFYAKHERASAETVIDHLARDLDNPSSILACFETARQNGRSVRTALTVDMWEAVNATWLEMRRLPKEEFTPARVGRVLDRVKERSLLFGGAVGATMLRSDAYWFSRLGTFVERADNTARILDVKFHVLLPQAEPVGGSVDYYQWTAILRSVSALRAYHWVYRDRIKPWLVAELLILRPEMPRSLMSCLGEISRQLEVLGQAYGTRGECHRLAGELEARLRFGRIDAIFQSGLHEFLTDFIDKSTVLGDEIGRHYLF